MLGELDDDLRLSEEYTNLNDGVTSVRSQLGLACRISIEYNDIRCGGSKLQFF